MKTLRGRFLKEDANSCHLNKALSALAAAATFVAMSPSNGGDKVFPVGRIDGIENGRRSRSGDNMNDARNRLERGATADESSGVDMFDLTSSRPSHSRMLKRKRRLDACERDEVESDVDKMNKTDDTDSARGQSRLRGMRRVAAITSVRKAASRRLTTLSPCGPRRGRSFTTKKMSRTSSNVMTASSVAPLRRHSERRQPTANVPLAPPAKFALTCPTNINASANTKILDAAAGRTVPKASKIGASNESSRIEQDFGKRRVGGNEDDATFLVGKISSSSGVYIPGSRTSICIDEGGISARRGSHKGVRPSSSNNFGDTFGKGAIYKSGGVGRKGKKKADGFVGNIGVGKGDHSGLGSGAVMVDDQV
jgi:hypothetical protein